MTDDTDTDDSPLYRIAPWSQTTTTHLLEDFEAWSAASEATLLTLKDLSGVADD